MRLDQRLIVIFTLIMRWSMGHSHLSLPLREPQHEASWEMHPEEELCPAMSWAI